MTKLPWICEGCGHFMVTRTDPVDIAEPPQHHCPIASRTLVLTAYKSAEHAADINRRLAARE